MRTVRVVHDGAAAPTPTRLIEGEPTPLIYARPREDPELVAASIATEFRSTAAESNLFLAGCKLHLRSCSSQTAPTCQCREIVFHEAGHAVACLAFGVRLLRVDVRRRRGLDGLGRVEHGGVAFADHNQIIAAAGPVAESIAMGRRPRGCRPDFKVVEQAPNPHEILVKAGALLGENWPAVRRLALELLSRPLLFGSEVRQLLGGRRRSRCAGARRT